MQAGSALRMKIAIRPVWEGNTQRVERNKRTAGLKSSLQTSRRVEFNKPVDLRTHIVTVVIKLTELDDSGVECASLLSQANRQRRQTSTSKAACCVRLAKSAAASKVHSKRACFCLSRSLQSSTPVARTHFSTCLQSYSKERFPSYQALLCLHIQSSMYIRW